MDANLTMEQRLKVFDLEYNSITFPDKELLAELRELVQDGYCIYDPLTDKISLTDKAKQEFKVELRWLVQDGYCIYDPSTDNFRLTDKGRQENRK